MSNVKPPIDLGDFERVVDAILAGLPERHTQVYKWRTGIGGEQLTYVAIAKRMGVSAERARQLFNKCQHRIDSAVGVYRVPPAEELIIQRKRWVDDRGRIY